MTDLHGLLEAIFVRRFSYDLAERLAEDLDQECDTITDAYQRLEPRQDDLLIDGNGYGISLRKRAREAIRENFPRHDYTRQFALIGCSSSKNPGYLPARRKYDADASPYWKWKRAYAETVADRYFILSAKHHLLQPTQYIGDYDRSLNEMDTDETEEWSERVSSSLEWYLDFWYRHNNGETKRRYYDEIVVLAGQSYVNPIRDCLEGLPLDVHLPFEDTAGIGEQISWLKERVQESHSDRRSYEASEKQSTVSAFAKEETA